MQRFGHSRAPSSPFYIALEISSNRVRFLLAALLLGAGLPSFASGATITVRPDGTGDYPTIQEALWYAVDGDVIELADGVFQGDLNHDIDFRDKAVTVRSASGDPGNVVVHCDSPTGPHAGFLFDGAEGPSSVIEGITIRNATQGVLCESTSPTLLDCRLNDCATGVRIRGGAARIERCEFTGGPMLGEAMLISGATTAQIVSCTFRDHASYAAVRQTAGTPTLEGCLFENNTTGFSGDPQPSAIVSNCDFIDGGFSVDGTGSPSFTNCRIVGGRGSGLGVGVVDHCTFSDHDATSVLAVGAGAVVRSSRFERNHTQNGVIRVFNGVARIEGCAFWDNTGEQGGAIYGEYSAARFENCLFVRNSATRGGVVYFQFSPATIIRCTFVGSSSTAGSAFYLDGADPLIENSIIAFGTGSEPFACFNGGAPLMTCSDVYGTSDSDWDGCLAGQLGERGNISADPLFCSRETDDYTLAASSPASEEHSGCGQMGALPVGCSDPVPTVRTSWGGLKARFIAAP